MITSHGARCDVCADFILDGDTNPFEMKGIDGALHCHDGCKPKLQAAIRAGSWRELPEGPIRQAFEKAEANL